MQGLLVGRRRRPAGGAWFTGRNERPGRAWETRSVVVTADRGQEFAFVVGGSWVRWGYTFAAVDGGTQVTESWAFLPEGVARFRDRFGSDARPRSLIAPMRHDRHSRHPRRDQEGRGIGMIRHQRVTSASAR